jgi:hypothetical protein
MLNQGLHMFIYLFSPGTSVQSNVFQESVSVHCQKSTYHLEHKLIHIHCLVGLFPHIHECTLANGCVHV